MGSMPPSHGGRAEWRGVGARGAVNERCVVATVSGEMRGQRGGASGASEGTEASDNQAKADERQETDEECRGPGVRVW